MNSNIKIEGIAESVKHSIDFCKSKQVDRIELVKDLNKGGLTPDIKVIKLACEETIIPIYVMVRPHDKSFIYSDEDFDKIKNDISLIKKTKAKGIVFGSLTKDDEINFEQLKEVVELSTPLKVTFHRAIDSTKDYLKSIKQLNDYDIENILTSGSKPRAIDGIDFLKEAIKISNHNIMPGSGIDHSTIIPLKNLNVKFLHFGFALRDKYDNISNEKISYLKNQLLEKG